MPPLKTYRPPSTVPPGSAQTKNSRSVFWGALCLLLAVLSPEAAAQQADEWIGVSASRPGGIGFATLDPETGSFSPITLTNVAAGISRDGRRIAYRRGSELRVSNVDGTEDRLLVGGLGDPNVNQTVRWSPAGDRIAFLTSARVIQIVSGSGAPLGEISDGHISGVSNISDFDWSPDGSRIAYGMTRGVQVPIAKKRSSDRASINGAIGTIRVRNLENGVTQTIHETSASTAWVDDHFVVYISTGASPSGFRWSPTGDQLAIGFYLTKTVSRASTSGPPLPSPTEFNDDQRSLAVFDIRSGAFSLLFTSHWSAFSAGGYPLWSPDGSQIAHFATDGVYIISSTTSAGGLPPLGSHTPPGRLLAPRSTYPGTGVVRLLDWIDPNPVRFTISTPSSSYDPEDVFTAKVTASLTRPEPHTIGFHQPLLRVDDPTILEPGNRSPIEPVELTIEQPSVSFSVPVTALERGVAELAASATATNESGTQVSLQALKKISVNPLEVEIDITPPNLVLNITPQSKKSPDCVLLENGVPKRATNCLEIVARVRNLSAFDVRKVGITFAEDVLALIQSRNLTNPGVPLRLVVFTPPNGLEPNGEASRVDLAPGETAVFKWNLDAFAAPASLSIKVRATGELKNTEVTGFLEKDFKVVDKVLLEWGIRPVDGRTSFLSGQPVRVEGYLKNVSKEAGEGRNLVALVYQMPEGNVGGGYMVPADRLGMTADRYFIFELPAEGDLSRIAIGAAFRSFPTYAPAKGKVRYGIRLWVREDNGSLTPATDQAVLDEEWLEEFQVSFAAAPPAPDGYREECLEAGVPAMICGISQGIYFEGGEAVLGLIQFAGQAGAGLKNLGGMILSQHVFLANRLWRTAKGDPAALDALIQEAYVEYLTFVNLGVMAGEAGGKIPMAFEAFSISTVGAVDRFFRAVDEGDLEEVQFQVGKFFGANPDLLFEPLVVARKFQILSRELKNLADGAADNVVAAAARQEADRQAASLEQRLAAAEADPNVTDMATALRAGDQLSDNLLARIYGISSEQRRRLQDLAKRYDVILSFRPRHPLSLDLIARKLAWPKPQALKWKGVSQIDIDFLGYRPEALARLELMEPPASLLGKNGTEELSQALDAYMEALKAHKPKLNGNAVLEAEVRDRLKTQVEYWEKLSPAHDLKDTVSTTKIDIDFDAGAQFPEKVGRKAGVTDSRTLTHTPVEPGIDEVTGATRRRWELQMSGPNGTTPRFVTGDVDFLAILDRNGGLILDENMRIKLYHELAVLMDMQHGESFTFFLQHARVEHLRCCVEGAGEAMATIGPWGRSTPTAGYFVDNLSIFEDGPNTKFLGPRKQVVDPEGKPKFDKEGKPVVIRRNDPTGEFMLIHGMPSAASVKYGLISHFVPLTFKESIASFFTRLPFYFPTYLARLFSEETTNGILPGLQDHPGRGPGLLDDPLPVELFFHEGGPVIQAGAATPIGRLRVWTRQLGWKPVTRTQAIALGQPGVADIAPMTSVAGEADAGARTFDITEKEELEITGRFFQAGDQIVLNPGGANQEFAVLRSLQPFSIASPLAFNHDRGEVIAFLQAGAQDSDEDGLSDTEELAMRTLPNDPDTDQDGFLDGYEALLGTDPLNAASLLRVLSVSHDPGAGSVSIMWTSVPGRTYTVELRTGIDSGGIWSSVATATAGEAASVITIANQEAAIGEGRFYRIRFGD